MSANYKNLESEYVKKKIGSMYLGVYLETDDPFGLSLSAVFLIRRSIFVATTFLLIDHPALQLQAFIFTSVSYMTYLKITRIYEDKFMLNLELLNESLFLLCSYHFLMFTNILNDPHTLEILGSSMIFIVVGLLIVAALVMLSVTFKVLFIKCKLLCMKSKTKRSSRVVELTNDTTADELNLDD